MAIEPREPQATPQPPLGLPEIEPIKHVRLTPAWQDATAGNWWLLEVPGIRGETAETRHMISERHVVELLLAFGRAVFDSETPRAMDAVLTLCEMSLLSETDAQTVDDLRALLVRATSQDEERGGA